LKPNLQTTLQALSIRARQGCRRRVSPDDAVREPALHDKRMSGAKLDVAAQQ
jgi:hypothetical protein